MSIKECVSKLQAAQDAERQAEIHQQKAIAEAEKAILSERLSISTKFLEDSGAENIFNEVNTELLNSKGFIRKINGIFTFTFKKDHGGDYTSSWVSILAPVAGVNLTWQGQGSTKGIFAGVHTPKKQEGNTCGPTLRVFTEYPNDGDMAANFLYGSSYSRNPVESIENLVRKTVGLLGIEIDRDITTSKLKEATINAISKAVFIHINSGNIDRPH